jgi:hypothetical protein
MRRPNQPDRELIAEVFSEMAPDQIAKVALLAVRCATELGKDNVYGAWELIEWTTMDAEEKQVLWLFFDSSQRSAIRSISEQIRQNAK